MDFDEVYRSKGQALISTRAEAELIVEQSAKMCTTFVI